MGRVGAGAVNPDRGACEDRGGVLRAALLKLLTERAAARSERSGVEVEVARRLLLEPEAVVLRRLLEEVRRLLERVLLGLRLGLGLVVEAPLVGLGGRGPA